ncbi:hypothetical protein CPB83DRAFT_854116 [Crepidotus variabilis]|uniref:Uncharacterized protein n=1 Tax=Crepidotus variabilis TaxID=179855 RepID=A0A9P6JPZ3_9AGAR|nr:hypothetical protein CPB83DRAFT_854116 [Crepidotus variabilis]
MNKLRKPPSSSSHSGSSSQNGSSSLLFSGSSMTMKHATSTQPSSSQGVTSSWVPTIQAARSQVSLPLVPERDDNIVPLTVAEQYWATRALKAEALLAAQKAHKQEFRTLADFQDMKRQREMALLANEYKEKHTSLERLLTFLLLLIAFMVMLIIYLATHYTRHSMLLHQKQNTSWWSAIGASHFTIPILSPFTSVVEHESSIFGAKIIGTLAAIGAVLLYFVFRYWFFQSGQRRKGGETQTPLAFSLATDDVSGIVNGFPTAIDQ